jgi:hypothetical protein
LDPKVCRVRKERPVPRAHPAWLGHRAHRDLAAHRALRDLKARREFKARRARAVPARPARRDPRG